MFHQQHSSGHTSIEMWYEMTLLSSSAPCCCSLCPAQLHGRSRSSSSSSNSSSVSPVSTGRDCLSSKAVFTAINCHRERPTICRQNGESILGLHAHTIVYLICVWQVKSGLNNLDVWREFDRFRCNKLQWSLSGVCEMDADACWC